MPTIVVVTADGQPVRITKSYSKMQQPPRRVYADRAVCDLCGREFWEWPDKPSFYCPFCIAADPGLLKPFLYGKRHTVQDPKPDSPEDTDADPEPYP